MTPQGRRLARAYQRTQRLLARAITVRLRLLWPTLVTGRLTDTAEPWVASASAVVAAGHDRAVDLSAGFYRQLRLAETGTGTVELVRHAPDPQRVRRILMGAGPGLIMSNLAAGMTFDQAASKAEYWANGAATREVLAGGRETLRASSVADRRAGGWARAASGDACAFCAALASRGYAFGREETADFPAHANCNCYPVPAFSRGQALPENSDQFRQQWEESDGTLQDFRRLREGRGDT